MNKIKAIIFDFDGVIAESVNVKTEAFAELYKPYGDKVVKKVVDHHVSHGGISRYKKFRLYHKKFLSQNINDDKVNKLAHKFSKMVVNKVVEAPYVVGTYEFISNDYKNYDFYISSGTPQKEINKIAKKRNIAQFFKGIYGSPTSKDEHTKKIMEKNNYQNDEVVFIGDAPSDRKAAKNNDIYFIARVDDEKSILKNEKNNIGNLNNLSKIIEKFSKENSGKG